MTEFKSQKAIKKELVYDAMVKIDPRIFAQYEEQKEEDKRVSTDESADGEEGNNAAERSLWGFLSTIATLEALSPALKSGSTVLDIGSGLSYTSLLIAHIMNASPPSSITPSTSTRVICVDNNDRALAIARKIVSVHYPHLQKFLTWQKANVLQDMSLSFMKEGPFSAIHVGGAISEIPDSWYQKLETDGIITAPIIQPSGVDNKMILCSFLKTSDHNVTKRPLADVDFECLLK